jgi:hypothetical protein
MAKGFTTPVAFTADTYQTELEDISRQRQLAQALQQMSFQPTQNDPTPGARVSWTQGLAKMLQAYKGRQGMEDAKTREGDLRTRMQTASGENMKEAQGLLQGAPAQAPQWGMDESQGFFQSMGPPSEAVPAKPGSRSAYLAKLLENPNPQVAQSALAQSMKEGDEKFGTAPHYEQGPNGPIAVAYGDRGTRKEIGSATPRDKMEFVNLGGTTQAVNPFQTAPGQQFTHNDPNKPISGSGAPNQAFQDYELRKAQAGATKVQTNVDMGTKFHGALQENIAKQIGTTTDQARAALGTLNTVAQIRQAMDSGMVRAGPGTTAQQFLGQIGQVLGVSGKDATQQLTQTRTAIQGLAQLELDAAQQMKGQGQITEAERGIIRRAAAGDIDSMTLPEMRALMGVMDRSARFKIQQNQQNQQMLQQDPHGAVAARFMGVQAPPAYQQPQGQPQQQPQGNVVDFNSLPQR